MAPFPPTRPVNFYRLVQTTQRAMHPDHAVFPLNIHDGPDSHSAHHPPCAPRSLKPALLAAASATPFDRYAITAPALPFGNTERHVRSSTERGSVQGSLAILTPEELAHVVSEVRDPKTYSARRWELVQMLTECGPSSSPRSSSPASPTAPLTPVEPSPVYASIDTPVFTRSTDVGKKDPTKL